MALLGGQFKSATHGQFKSAQGGHFDRILHPEHLFEALVILAQKITRITFKADRLKITQTKTCNANMVHSA